MARGVHGRQGPPPDPLALRRDRKRGLEGWEVLPPEGRTAPAPFWPLTEQSEREAVLWADEWARPQAVKWEQNGQEIEVAMYVRTLVAAESVDATAAMRVLVLRQQEHLGLTMAGLARNKWQIGEIQAEPAPVKAAKAAPKARKAAPASVRDRLKVLDGGG